MRKPRKTGPSRKPTSVRRTSFDSKELVDVWFYESKRGVEIFHRRGHLAGCPKVTDYPNEAARKIWFERDHVLLLRAADVLRKRKWDAFDKLPRQQQFMGTP